jgi:hypothetical protein
VVVTTGGFVNGGVGKYFALPAEGVKGFGLTSTVGANIAGWEDLVIAVRADFADQSVTLLLKTPMTRDFHFDFS